MRHLLPAATILMALSCSAWALELGGTLGPVELTALSGETIVMKNYSERPGTAIVFLSSRCPVTEKVIGDLNAIYRKYRLRDVLFVGISANPEESGDELRTFAQHRGLIFPIYRDPTGTVTKQFAATKTPQLFLVDREARLAFHGGLQDNAARQALEAAIVSLGKPPAGGASHAVEGTPIDRPGPKRRHRRSLRHDLVCLGAGVRKNPHRRGPSLLDDLRSRQRRPCLSVVRRQLRIGRRPVLVPGSQAAGREELERAATAAAKRPPAAGQRRHLSRCVIGCGSSGVAWKAPGRCDAAAVGTVAG